MMNYLALSKGVALRILVLIFLTWGLSSIQLEVYNIAEARSTQIDLKSSIASSKTLPVATLAMVYYVSKNGTNADGRSWTTAWNELNQIDWSIIHPGDTIMIDGGSNEMVYTTTLKPRINGTIDNRVTIKLANEAGRNGKAVIFGGRSIPLPYCEQTNYTYQTDGIRDGGININDSSWLEIDGMKWRGITIYGHNSHGIQIDNDSSYITIRNVEIYDNGSARHTDEGWKSNRPGVRLAGHNNTFERVIIHDNGQDAIQSISGDNNLGNFVLRQSWLYNGRQHPTVNEAFNYCVHTDGLQIYDGGIISGVTIEESIIGPGFTQGVILGQRKTQSGAEAIVNDVLLKNVLFAKSAGINIMGYQDVKSERWVIDRVTNYCITGYTGVCLWLEGSGHSITNSIFNGSRIRLSDGLDNFSGNCQWDTKDFQLGQVANPLFVNVNHNDPFSLDNYALQPHSPCLGAGSSLTSVIQLLVGQNPNQFFLPIISKNLFLQ